MLKFINNNQTENIFLIHGWATDSTIFANLKIPYNYILVDNQNPYEIIDEIYNYCIQNNKKIINILGWSMGSFVAIDFAKKYTNEISVKNLILLSVCSQYDKADIKNIHKFLQKNPNLYLENFYQKCFYDGENSQFFNTFKSKYFNNYLQKFTMENLNIGLNYLEQASLDIEILNNLATKTKIKIINSVNDDIIKNPDTTHFLTSENLSQNIKLNLLKNYGHAFFLENFSF